MIIFDFLKELEKYVDLTMLSQLSTESVEKLTNYSMKISSENSVA